MYNKESLYFKYMQKDKFDNLFSNISKKILIFNFCFLNWRI